MSKPLIQVENLSKKFCRDLKKSLWYGVVDLGNEIIGRDHGGGGTLRDGEFWAVNAVNFELHPGESLGLIGNNGAGKTSLLRLLNGLIKPDTGSIKIRGQMGALIALGAGYNPILSGRENIYINASILGLRNREIHEKLDDIIEFSELNEFIDAPVQSYSSGMQVRLAFSVAVHLNPDVMLVDEALAVGDARFQKKCFDRIQHMRNQGTGFIVVSHNPYQIESACQKVAVMHRGTMSEVSDSKQALTLYHDLVQKELKSTKPKSNFERAGTGELIFESLEIQDANGNPAKSVNTFDRIRLVAKLYAKEPASNVRLRFEVCSENNAIVIMATTVGIFESIEFKGNMELVFTMKSCQLTTGWYYVNAVAVKDAVRLDTWQRASEFKVIQPEGKSRDLSTDQGVFVCEGEWEIEYAGFKHD